jgi:cytosolic carboxypeptidase protein 5
MYSVTCCSNAVPHRRHYLHPTRAEQPCIYAINQLLSHYAHQDLLSYFIDLHAHANRRGVFTYGNALQGAQHLDALLFNKLVAMNSPHFDFSGCNFTERNMSTRDRDGTTKDGAGRVAWFRQTGLTHLYTVEASYNGPKHVAEVAPASGEGVLRASPSPALRTAARYDVAAFQQVRCACVDGH